MPITPLHAFSVVCDVCHRPLAIPDGTDEPNRPQFDLFLTAAHAQALAAYMGWTFDDAHFTCPQCSDTVPTTQKEA